ncbi:HD family phosphohydrolase [Clostridium sp.]|uniref:HD family phosphohydrolase n=1 Tax=Clostridium sp. TaxID=1506 RepID=UPI00399142E9
MNKKFKKERLLGRDFKRPILFVVVFFIIYLILATALITKKYDLKVGDIPKADIKANKEIIDQSATNARKKMAAEKVDKKYSLISEIKQNSENQIKDFFIAFNKEAQSNSPTEEKVKNLANFKNLSLTNDDYNALFTLNKEQINQLESILIESLDVAYESPITEGNNQQLTDAKDNALTVIIESSLPQQIKNIASSMVENLIKPNFVFDQQATEEAVNEAMKEVAPVMIKKNQIIVKEGEPVTEQQIEELRELGLLNDSNIKLYIYLSLGLLIVLVLYVQYRYAYKYYRKIYNDFSKLVLISIINILAILVARIITMYSPFLIPLACAPILLTLLIDYKLSLVISILNVILIATVTNFNGIIIIIAILGAVLGSTILRRMQQRNDILYAALLIALISSGITLSLGALTTNNMYEIFLNTLLVAMGAILSGVLAVGILPFFESTFDIVTTVKLLELSNPNSPLLKKLLMEAPGTYHHSILVSNLAEVAAEEIGANSLLARIGAFYHDIGKTKRPYYFRENQIGIDNPHDKVSSRLSAKIITSHVTEGEELAKQHNLPREIERFIVTHHGDTLVKYFYLTEKKNSDNPDSVKEEDFKYAGPTPSTKEEGIVMLSDSVEAAVRSIKDPNMDKIETMVNNIVKDKLESGQLNNCDLTLKDIEKIKKCFLKALNGIYHQRIEYPKEEKEKK